MRFLSLFTGIGGLDLGLERAGMTCVGQVEIDDYCNQILEERWSHVPRWRDIKSIPDGWHIEALTGPIDLIVGGFPCQDISVAGKGAGLDGVRSGLWWEMWRIINDLRPNWVLIENVPALRTKGYDTICDALESIDHTPRAVVVGGEHVGAPHKRHRAFTISNSNSLILRKQPGRERRQVGQDTPESREDDSLSYSYCQRCEGFRSRGLLHIESAFRSNSDRCDCPEALEFASSVGQQRTKYERERLSKYSFPSYPGCPQQQWEAEQTTKVFRTPESRMGFTADGIPVTLALKAIGNSVMPPVGEVLGRAIITTNTQLIGD